MAEVLLSDKDNQLLRERGLIQGDEVALRSGDLVIAENVVTKTRRVLSGVGPLLESAPRQVLLD